MSEEITNETDVQSTPEDKNWKAIREENKALKDELAQFQVKERDTLFQEIGLDRTKGIGKAADQMYEGDLAADALKAFVTEEFGEDVFGQQDSFRNTVNAGQERLDNLASQAQAVNANTSVQEQIAEAQKSGRVRDSIASKMQALDELKEK
tara:strand:- start:204 stop:656 length:453 start_codon:yes stop_codon:yes gene_type:complete